MLARSAAPESFPNTAKPGLTLLPRVGALLSSRLKKNSLVALLGSSVLAMEMVPAHIGNLGTVFVADGRVGRDVTADGVGGVVERIAPALDDFQIVLEMKTVEDRAVLCFISADVVEKLATVSGASLSKSSRLRSKGVLPFRALKVTELLVISGSAKVPGRRMVVLFAVAVLAMS